MFLETIDSFSAKEKFETLAAGDDEKSSTAEREVQREVSRELSSCQITYSSKSRQALSRKTYLFIAFSASLYDEERVNEIAKAGLRINLHTTTAKPRKQSVEII